jgi:hypothetical protein
VKNFRAGQASLEFRVSALATRPERLQKNWNAPVNSTAGSFSLSNLGQDASFAPFYEYITT